jgi:type IV pilus assembly protein PilC
MKKIKGEKIQFDLNDLYLSDFAQQMSEILKAGMTVEDGLTILYEDSIDGSEESKLYKNMLEEIREHGELSVAMSMVGGFPEDMVKVIGLGEKTGHLERILKAQSMKYKRL